MATARHVRTPFSAAFVDQSASGSAPKPGRATDAERLAPTSHHAPEENWTPAPVGDAPHAVIVGGGFAGLACAKAMGKTTLRVTVVDQRNYHLSTPLLYQVATAALSPADVTAPIRQVLSSYPNVDTVMGRVEGVVTGARPAPRPPA